MGEPLFSCQCPPCAQEVSYHADMLRLYEGEPCCMECYNEMASEGAPLWEDAEPFVPEFAAENEHLKTLNAELVEALRPFAEAADDLDDDHRDNSEVWESSAAMSIDAKHLREARTLIAKAESSS